MPHPVRASTPMFLQLLVAVCWLGVCVASAEAQRDAQLASPAEDQAERDRIARAEFEVGRVAYEEGRYRDALDSFRRAYRLSDRPQLLYNIGQAADRLGQDREALEAFKLYLERRPDAHNRREVENRVRALEERVQAAQPEPSEPAEPSPAPEPEVTSPWEKENSSENRSAQPKRSGYYVRTALGVGLRRDGVSDDSLDATLSGAGLSGELAIGATLAKGLALGGVLVLDWSSGLSQSVRNAFVAGANAPEAIGEFERANLTMLGVMADYYPRSERDGLHLQAALALASLAMSPGQGAVPSVPVGTKTASGFGLVLGGGYEWPLHRDWAIGVLGRIAFAAMSEGTRSHVMFAPSVLCSLTWW